MTCVLGMVVRREREIRAFVKTPFYRVLAGLAIEEGCFEAEWRVTEHSKYYKNPCLYKENGFKEKKTAQELIDFLLADPPLKAVIASVERKKENKKEEEGERGGQGSQEVSIRCNGSGACGQVKCLPTETD